MQGPVVHITGARPNFPKAAPVVAALREAGVDQRLVHTGQHYDDPMSEVFFRELDLPRPDVNLGVGSGSHAQQTAAVMTQVETVLLDLRPSLVVVYGDINSTVAAALVAAKLGVPVAHVEAGLRSFDSSMPEEINRRLTDQLSDLLFATSAEAVGNLGREGLPLSAVHFVGNPMIDTLLASLPRLDADQARRRWRLPQRYAVATLHRPANVDDPADAGELVKALHAAADAVPLLVPLHPRGRASLEAAGLSGHRAVRVTDPLGYVEFLSLVAGATAVITDSGGVQEETTVLGVACLTMRPNTERPVTITHGTNRLVTRHGLADALVAAMSERGDAGSEAPRERRPALWDGRAGQRIARIVEDFLAQPHG
jgi:UDP-N-acetylglucosamine 2-epimerase (non-hydrolysing)